MQTDQIADQRTEADRFHTAMRALFHPQRIAVVGATPKMGFANNIHRLILKFGYEGDVFGVNPRYDEVLGSPCYPSLDAIPGGVDKAVVVVPSHLVMGILEDAARAGVKACNIITSGFGEQADEEAHERQLQVRAFARRTGIRCVGPNCLGIISTPASMVAMSGPYQALHPGPVGLVFQSGLMAYTAIVPPTDRGIGFSYVVTTGNEADLEAADFIRYYVEDARTRVIGCFIEQFRDPDKLRAVAALAADAGKPIVVLKIGRSEGGKRSAQAHTGSLVGSDDVIDAVMRQLGIIRVYNMDEMTETLAALHTRKLPRSTGVGAIFVSGGAAGLISDLAQDIGIHLPPLAPHTAERLKNTIPEYGSVGNPLDTTGQAAQIPGLWRGVLETMAEDPNLDTIVYGQAFPVKVDLAGPAGEVMAEMPAKFPDKVFYTMSLGAGVIQEGFRADIPPQDPTIYWDGIPFLQGAENGLRAVKHVIDYAEWLRHRGPGIQAAAPSAVAADARALVAAGGGRPLVEREAKRLLALYGIPVTRELLVTNADDAVAAAADIGYPVVLKIESPDIAHKTEAGGVLLGLADADAVYAGFQQIVDNARSYNPAADVRGVLVQEMVSGGRELILGMTQDPSFGPAVAVGLGGIFVEILKDVALGVPPLTERDRRAMIERLRGRAILEGARGAAPSDVDAVVAILGRFSQLCIDLRDDVAEIDINPLLVFEQGRGAKVVDCLIVPK